MAVPRKTTTKKRKPAARPVIDVPGETVTPEPEAAAATPAPEPASSPEAPSSPAPTSPANGAGNMREVEELAQLAAALLMNSKDGIGPAQDTAAQIPRALAGEIVQLIIPEEWRDEAARAWLTGFDDATAARLLAWLARQWWDGYGVGFEAAKRGEDLRSVA